MHKMNIKLAKLNGTQGADLRDPSTCYFFAFAGQGRQGDEASFAP